MVRDAGTNLFIPVFYVLMSGKTEWEYWSVFNEILIATELQLKPSFIHCDFEKGLIKALKDQFGMDGAKIVGCFFHFKQAILRKLLKLEIPKEEREIAIAPGTMKIENQEIYFFFLTCRTYLFRMH